MNEVAIKTNSYEDWVEKVQQPFQSIRTWKDLEVWILQGQGLAGNTYDAYAQALRQFYEFTEGLHPKQWTPEYIEAFYDQIRRKYSIATAYNRMEGLKNICRAIQRRIPWYQSPFDSMNEKTKAKLSTTPRGKKKSALYQKELNAVYEHLQRDGSLYNQQNLSMILTLVTTGLRAYELCNLTWGDLEHDTDQDTWYFTGIGKGNKPFTVEIHPKAVNMIFATFRRQFKRDPRPEEAVFWSAIPYNGKYQPMKKSSLWVRLRDIGNALKRKGKIRQSIQFSAHLFRRTWATLNLKNGMDITALADAGRWSNIQTLQKHYADTLTSTQSYTDKIVEAV